MKRLDPAPFIVRPQASVKEALAAIDANKEGIALVADKEGPLLGTLTDGDIRRFMLKGNSLDQPCSQAMCGSPRSLSATAGEAEIEACLRLNRLRHVPLLDANGLAKALVARVEAIVPDGPKTAVIMAGGEGRRLRPITEKIPKPMIPVKGRPILEWSIERLVSSGVEEIFLAVNYMAERIEEHFADGSRFGARIHYLRERKKLGTAGALSLLPSAPEFPFLVMNGDILTDVDFRSFYKFHVDHRSLLTIASMQYNVSVPFGVLENSGALVLGVREKPTSTFLCNAGMYVVDPFSVDFIPKDDYYDITSLVNALVGRGLAVHTFPIHESWVDVGRKSDLVKVDDSYADAFDGFEHD